MGRSLVSCCLSSLFCQFLKFRVDPYQCSLEMPTFIFCYSKIASAASIILDDTKTKPGDSFSKLNQLKKHDFLNKNCFLKICEGETSGNQKENRLILQQLWNAP